MLTIKTIENIDEVIAYLKEKNICHTPGAEQFMGVYDGETLSAIGSIMLCGAKVYMNFIYTETESFELSFGLAKSLLNMADLRGIKTIYGNNTELERLYTALRFKKENDEYILPLEGYFTVESCK